ncbi:MFS transporter [Burkholderia guangdongensis]|uniref:MFS transporter n=1 Tax=Burkholderia guangdongensis TaxID=1792500 RepID=UPI0015CD425A|nr:MFS transporter [Burkholderia guangdongensis]
MKSILSRDFLALVLSIAVVGLGTGATLPLTALALTDAGHGTDVVGLLTAAQAFGGIATAPFVTGIARRCGARRVNVGCVLTTAVAIALMQVTSNLFVWGALRLVCGVALIMLFTVSEAWVNQIASDATRGRVVAIYSTTFTLFQLAGPVLVSQIAGLTHLRFAICGALFLLALPFLASIRSTPLSGTDLHTDLHDGLHDAHDDWHRVLPRMPALVIGTAFFALFDTLSLSLLPIYAIERGVAREAAVLLASIMLAGDTALQFPVGWLADRLGRTRVHVGAGCVVLALLPLMPVAISHPWLGWPYLFVLGAAAGSIYMLSLVACGERFRGAALVTASSLTAASWSAASFGGPLVAGALMQQLGGNALVGVLIAGVLAFLAAVQWERRALPRGAEPSAS